MLDPATAADRGNVLKFIAGRPVGAATCDEFLVEATLLIATVIGTRGTGRTLPGMIRGHNDARRQDRGEIRRNSNYSIP
jgi:hypothetical protein